MHATRSRRLAAGLAAAVAGLAAVAGSWPVPAFAAEEPADLWVTVTPEQVEATPGDVIPIVITIGNDGPEDPVTPRYTIFTSPRLRAVAVPDGCHPVGTGNDFFDCPIESLAAGTEIRREVTIEVLNFHTDGVSVSVLDGPLGEPVPSGNTATTRIQTATADLWTSIDPERAIVAVGATVEVTVSVGNRGPRDAVEPRFVLLVSRGLELVAPPDDCRKRQSSVATTYDCPIAALAAGTQVSQVVRVRLAVWSGSEEAFQVFARDAATGEESGFALLSIQPPTTSDIFVEVPPVTAPVGVGKPFEVTLTVGNAGPQVARSVVVRLGLGSEDEPQLQELFPAAGGRPPSNCRTEGEDQPVSVVCTLASVPVNGTVDLVYPLRARSLGEHRAQVSVTLTGEDAHETAEDARKDNHATLVVQVARRPPGGSGGGGSPPSGSPGLPVTGTDLPVLVALAGLALVGGGALLVRTGRRRRYR